MEALTTRQLDKSDLTLSVSSSGPSSASKKRPTLGAMDPVCSLVMASSGSSTSSSSGVLAGTPPPARWVSCRSSFPENVLNESNRLSRFIALPPRLIVRPGAMCVGAPPGIGCDRNITLGGLACCCGGGCSASCAPLALDSRWSSCTSPACTGSCMLKAVGEDGRLIETGCADLNPCGLNGESNCGRTASLR
jgi:hypothetical protein